MAAWRLVVHALYELGPTPSLAIESHIKATIDLAGALTKARRLGLVESPGMRGGLSYPWRLTPLGVDWCEGRVTQIEVRPGGRRWVSTWLSSLPRGVKVVAT